MPAEYRFLDRWRVAGSLEEIRGVLANGADYPRWWRCSYLEALTVVPGDDTGLGERTLFRVKGWLPYTLILDLECTGVRPDGIDVVSRGDLEGTGAWTWRAEDGLVDVSYEWIVLPRASFLRRLTPVLRPVFASNHHWTFRRGLDSLELELARRRAAAAGEDVSLLPRPPRPTPSIPWRKGRLPRIAARLEIGAAAPGSPGASPLAVAPTTPLTIP